MLHNNGRLRARAGAHKRRQQGRKRQRSRSTRVGRNDHRRSRRRRHCSKIHNHARQRSHVLDVDALAQLETSVDENDAHRDAVGQRRDLILAKRDILGGVVDKRHIDVERRRETLHNKQRLRNGQWQQKTGKEKHFLLCVCARSKQKKKKRMQRLLSKSESGAIDIDGDTMSLLNRLGSDDVVVFGIVGVYRAGKSSLLNLLFPPTNATERFVVGQTTSGQTRGIWLRIVDDVSFEESAPEASAAAPAPVERRGLRRKLLLLDSEGLHDVRGDEQQDEMIFTLMALLSQNELLLNIKGVLDAIILRQVFFLSWDFVPFWFFFDL